MIIIYIKLNNFNFIEDFYDIESLSHIQELIKNFLSTNLKKHSIYTAEIKILENGEYLLTIKEKNIVAINKFISRLKTFQKAIKDKTINLNDISYQISLKISIVYSGEKRYESAKLGIKTLQNTNKNFIVSNNFAEIAKKDTLKKIKVINTIKEALKNSQVISYYQPIIDNQTKKIIKHESLMRIISKNKVLTPVDFLDIAKKGLCYQKLTKTVLHNSFETVKQHNKNISINLSIRDMESNQTRKTIYSLLKKYKDIAHKITFELLEDEQINDIKSITYFIKKVKQSGVKIAVDDFGKGFSNFERIICYKPDIIKIDGLLIKDIDKDPYSYSIVKTIVNFAKEQGIKTVAEFVENEKIYNCIKKLGVDFSQGYYFGKPITFKRMSVCKKT